MGWQDGIALLIVAAAAAYLARTAMLKCVRRARAPRCGGCADCHNRPTPSPVALVHLGDARKPPRREEV